MKISKQPLTQEIEKLVQEGLQAHAKEVTGSSYSEPPMSFFISDSNAKLLSAIVIQMLWGTICIKHVWTKKEHRGKGYASQLMRAVFEFAKTNKVPFASVYTFDFQAPSFYKKFGFTVVFKCGGYSNNASLYYMKRNFDTKSKTSTDATEPK